MDSGGESLIGVTLGGAEEEVKGNRDNFPPQYCTLKILKYAEELKEVYSGCPYKTPQIHNQPVRDLPSHVYPSL